MNYLLDTNTCIYIINKKPSVVLKRVQSKRPEQIAISTITVAELEYGVARSGYPERNRIALLEFLFPFGILDFDQKAFMAYGQIRTSLEARGKPVGPMDMLLAAQAESHNLILVTNNEREFGRIEGLRVENWVCA
ncbi:MAG: type II toxin-antitoxin system VapC family toxin [Sedimentisphaerales bacterium]|nr:type II toxin-antitoxin system VapC family toxin [Sedimentisphaerales bacterium]